MGNVTFEDLPKAVSDIQKRIDEIYYLLSKKEVVQNEVQDEVLTVQDTAKFLSLSVQTVYTLISKGELPVMKRSKRCYFSKVELINYLKDGRKKTNLEIETLAKNYSGKKN